jgi:uncharacterized damage-inducible protein DinB
MSDQSSKAAARDTFLETFDRECGITLKVLNAFPEEEAELRPADDCRSARELAFVFAMEQGLGERVVNGTLRLDGEQPKPPASFAECVAAFDQARKHFAEVIRGLDEEKLNGTVKFFTAPGTMSDIPTLDFLWFLLHDQIHHRGQFSVYLRMAGAKVPSIYGPSKDEPWF